MGVNQVERAEKALKVKLKKRPFKIKRPHIKKEVELSLQDLRDNIPDFDKYVQILRINCAHGDWGVLGTWPGYSLPIYTPVYGLYLVGDRSAPPGWWGSIAAVKSGRLVVEDVNRRFKPA